MSIPTLHVGQGAVVDALTVFPVWSSTAPAPRRYLTAKNADLTIAERDGAPVVGELVVTNNSDAPVLLVNRSRGNLVSSQSRTRSHFTRM